MDAERQPKRLFKIGAISLNQTPLDWLGNKQRILRGIEKGREEGCSVLCFPELCVTGYGAEDAFFNPDLYARAANMLLEIEPYTRGLLVVVGAPILYADKRYDCAACFVDGKLSLLSPKRYLANDGIHYEARWFTPWTEGVNGLVSIAGREVPIGLYVVDVDSLRIGFEICEDAWVKERPVKELAKLSVDLVLNPSASHFAFRKFNQRKELVESPSREFQLAYVYANIIGNEAGRAIYDGGSLIAQYGKLVGIGRRFSFEEVVLTAATIEINEKQTKGASAYYEVMKIDFNLPQADKPSHSTSQAPWETSTSIKEEEFLRAVSLGTHDYIRKARAAGAVISLSGGADSATCALMVYFGINLAVSELGLENFRARFSYVPGIAACTSLPEITQRLLTCVYQATRNSSEITLDASKSIATALNASFLSCSVDSIVENYVDIVSQITKTSLNWQDHDVPLQNIQARARGPLVWLIANLQGALLLATSNRSEAAVGYTTMDGDTCGGLSPIAGIDKAYLLEWLVWMQTIGPIETGPLTVLKKITAQQPTAELRPQGSNQTDENDLMPYIILDAIERAAIRDRKSPREIFDSLLVDYPQYNAESLQLWVKRFFRLWSRNQWKRERYAPSFHLDDENLDPKTWCRFPILSGGFEVELGDF